jgi:catechol 2,3-dioxygenase-like lactoylglutathione lyase family enzyme
MSIRVSTVHHVSFRVDDLGKAVEFYRDVLGCEEIHRPDLGFPGAWLEAGDTQVHLIEHEATTDTGLPARLLSGIANHVAFRVQDLNAAAEELERHGLSIARGEILEQVFVQDPSGNVIELTPSQLSS